MVDGAKDNHVRFNMPHERDSRGIVSKRDTPRHGGPFFPPSSWAMIRPSDELYQVTKDFTEFRKAAEEAIFSSV